MKVRKIIPALAVSLLLLAGCSEKPGGIGKPTAVLPSDPTKSTAASQPAGEQSQGKETEETTKSTVAPRPAEEQHPEKETEETTKAALTPEPAELIGIWVQTHTLVEGDKQASEGSCTITITTLESKELGMSYVDPERADFQFWDALLILDERPLHYNCGNDVWVMDVETIGPYNTTYAITLTEDGTLIKQNYFLLDGAPTVSYEYFSRVD